MPSRRRPILAGVTAVVLLALGAGVAFGLDDALGIRSEDSEIPGEASGSAAVLEAVVPTVFSSITAPAASRIDAAVEELWAATGGVSTSSTSGVGSTSGVTASLVVTAGDGDTGDDSYTLGGTAESLTIDAASAAGAARGVYDLAAAARDGRSLVEHLGETVTSALPFRMVDLGAVGVTVDAAEWLPGTDYSHNSGAFRDVLLADEPYIDEAELATAQDEFEQYARHVAAEGYTAIAFPGLIEFLTFDDADVYEAGDAHVARAEAMREAFIPMWQFADELGLDVFLRTDMLTLTTPLEAYLTEQFGDLGAATSDPRLWQVYTDALDELYAAAPQLDGVLIRIGEAGRVYDLPGWDYYSELAVTDVASVRAMLTAFSSAAEAAEREVIFRSWSVGVGAVGDMHTDVDSYHAVLDGIDSPALIVSTKYTLGDFYSHLPLNDTLEVGDQRRIIEFQSRREFEAFGAFPNDLGDLYQQAIQRFTASNPHVEGIWTWTQDGGPWRAGPMTLELKSGFWQLYELNTELAVRLARDPDLNPADVTADWARRWLSDDPATVAAIVSAMGSSRAAITDGLYIGPYADRQVAAIGLHPPPMMWIFEWDILTGDSAVLDVIYAVSRSELDEAIDGGARALDAVTAMEAAIAATDPATWREGMRAEFDATLAYERSTLTVLAAYREMVLRQAQWHDTGDAAAYDAWSAALVGYRDAMAAHQATYAGDVFHPALNPTAADLGVERASRDLGMAWAARVLAVLVGLWLVLGFAAGASARVRRAVPGARVAWVHTVAATRPWRAASVVAGLGLRDRVLLVAVPAVALVASRGILTWFEAPAHMLTMLAGWAIFTAVVVGAARVSRRVPLRGALLDQLGAAVLATIGGVALLRVLLLSVVLAPTGPGGYWFHFWTDPSGRAIYVTVAFALFAWVIVAAGWAFAAVAGARRATGVVIGGMGAVLALIGALLAAVGLEHALTVWNDQLGLLPWGLSRILGITTYLEIPSESAVVVAGFGVVLLVVGLALALIGRRRTASRAL